MKPWSAPSTVSVRTLSAAAIRPVDPSPAIPDEAPGLQPPVGVSAEVVFSQTFVREPFDETGDGAPAQAPVAGLGEPE